MSWSGDDWTMRHPSTVCRVAPVTTAADGVGDVQVFETERESHELGYRWCECFTAGCIDGELAHIQEPLLLPLACAEFEAALCALRTGDDAVLDMWLRYRLKAVRHELLPPGALTNRDHALAPDFVLAPERLARP
jgi:hypothetical protein